MNERINVCMDGWLNGGIVENGWIRIVWVDKITTKVVVKVRLNTRLNTEVKVNRQTHLFSPHDTKRYNTNHLKLDSICFCFSSPRLRHKQSNNPTIPLPRSLTT